MSETNGHLIDEDQCRLRNLDKDVLRTRRSVHAKN